MRMNAANIHRQSRREISAICAALLLSFASALSATYASGQTPAARPVDNAGLTQRVQKLTDAMARTEARLEESQHELEQMRHELTGLLRELQPEAASPESAQSVNDQSVSSLDTAAEGIRERQDVVESQVATHEQSKVESASKYPLRLHGLMLFNTFVNTNRVDQAATPGIALGGPGSTGASMQQTVLGLDATGPHLLGAQSSADLDVDFDGGTGSAYGGSLVRLRTAHARLSWANSEAWFSLDRPLLSPLVPSSLTAVSQPALSWSGNLWAWNPQFGASHQFALNNFDNLRLQAGLMDVGDAPYSSVSTMAQILPPPTAAEQSRWPGAEAHIALVAPDRDDRGNQIGIGAYIAPHRAFYSEYKAWAASVDGRLHLPAGLELSGDFYRGLALGGLGGGAYKDYAYYANPVSGEYYFRPLDDMGGWAQLKEKITDRLEFNEAFGTDQIVAHQFRPYASGTAIAQNLVANRTFTGNAIFRPSAYLLFSLEYRHLQSNPANGAAATSNIIGLAAGYSF